MEHPEDYTHQDVTCLLDAISAEQHLIDLAFAEHEATELHDFPDVPVEHVDIDLHDEGFVITRRRWDTV